MIVVDTNIISYFYLNAEQSLLAEQTFQKDPVWAAPLLWRSEFRNVLTWYMRKNLLTLPESLEIFELAEEVLGENEYETGHAQILALASSSGCSAYDCEFVSLAKDLNVSLITEDRKILSSFPETALSMEHFIRGTAVQGV